MLSHTCKMFHTSTSNHPKYHLHFHFLHNILLYTTFYKHLDILSYHHRQYHLHLPADIQHRLCILLLNRYLRIGGILYTRASSYPSFHPFFISHIIAYCVDFRICEFQGYTVDFLCSPVFFIYYPVRVIIIYFVYFKSTAFAC